MSFLPAQRLEKATRRSASAGSKRYPGRYRRLHPETIQDHATFRAPTEASSGVRYLIVAGTVVVESGRILVEGVTPGPAFVSGTDSRRQDR